MKQFAKKSLVLFIALFFTAALSAKTPKYIFYCIGDGMSFAHVMATQLHRISDGSCYNKS